ncbi:uncharacterized protein SETTUDRAFT_111887, partial [Exserohilum turcica Et28A]
IFVRASQAKAAFQRIGRLANIETGLSPYAIRQLYLACVTSVADYGAPVYWHSQSYATKLLQPLHNLACRKVLGVFRTAPSIPATLKATLRENYLTIQLLLHTSKGREATLAFIAKTRVGTRGWHLG